MPGLTLLIIIIITLLSNCGIGHSYLSGENKSSKKMMKMKTFLWYFWFCFLILEAGDAQVEGRAQSHNCLKSSGVASVCFVVSFWFHLEFRTGRFHPKKRHMRQFKARSNSKRITSNVLASNIHTVPVSKT